MSAAVPHSPHPACTIALRFAPSQIGARSASLTVPTDEYPSSVEIDLTGEGIAPPPGAPADGGSTDTAPVDSPAPSPAIETTTPTPVGAGTALLDAATTLKRGKLTCKRAK